MLPAMSDHQHPPTVWPALRYADAPAAITFLVEAFGFEERCRYPDAPADVVSHAELRWPEGGGVMLGSTDRDDSEFSQGPTGTGSVYVVTDRVAGVFERARAAGADVVQPLEDKPYGGAGCTLRDLEGNLWSFGSYRGA